jgi:hypothetical protein
MRLVDLLSVLFPVRLDQKLTAEELEVSLDYRRRNRRTQPYYIWSAAGNLTEHPAKPKPTMRERRSREIPEVLSVGNRVFIMSIREADAAGPEATEANSNRVDRARVYAGQDMVGYS